MSAVVDTSGKVKIIKVASPKIERITVADLAGVANAEKLVRILNAQTDALASVFPRLPQEYIDFEVQMLPGTRYPLQHNYNGAVRCELVNWIPDSLGGNFNYRVLEIWPINAGAALPVSDANTLVVEAATDQSGFATFRVSPKGA